MAETQTPAPSAIEIMRQYSEAEAPRVAADLEAEGRGSTRLFAIPPELMQAMSVTICSIWPEAMDSQPFHHGGSGRKMYSIQPGSPEQPAYLRIDNTWDWITVQEGVGQRGVQQATIPAAQVAIDIIKHWTGDHPGNRTGRKGVGIIIGEWNQKRQLFTALPEEIALLEKQQYNFLRFLVERADRFWETDQREKISEEARKALRMLGLDFNQHPWYRSKIQLYNECPWCAEKVAVNAIFCKQCRSSIVDYFQEREIIPSSDDWPRVFQELARKTAGEPAGRRGSKTKEL